MRTELRLSFLAAGLLFCAGASAQLGIAISDDEMLGPWRQATALLGSLAVVPGAPSQSALKAFDEALAELRVQLENTAVHIVARPEFAYDAAQWSYELSGQVAKAGDALDAVLAATAVPDPGAVARVHESIQHLRDVLAGRSAFERDVLQTLGSGSRNAIQVLSRRWWTVSEEVEALRKAGARLRE